MGFFTSRIEERAKHISQSYPSASTGYCVPADTVVNVEIKNNPYFCAINNISPQDAAKNADSVKTGIAMLTKSPSVSKDVTIQISPLITDDFQGGASLKKAIFASSGRNDVVTLMHTIHQGDHFTVPTGIGVSIRGLNADASTQFSPAQVERNGSIDVTVPPTWDKTGTIGTPEDSSGEIAPFRPDVQKIFQEAGPMDITGRSEKAPTTAPIKSQKLGIDPNTGKKTALRETGRAVNGEPIRTGTLLATNVEIAMLVSCTYDSAQGMSF